MVIIMSYWNEKKVFKLAINNYLINSIAVLTKQGEDKTQEVIDKYCGVNFCPNTINSTMKLLHPPDPTEVTIMMTIYLCCSFAAVIFLSVFLDPLSK